MENDLIYRGSVKTKVSDMWWGEIDSIPAVDAVEVVRCRECKHGAYSEYYGNVACNAHLWVRGPEYFCADGQRREDGEA